VLAHDWLTRKWSALWPLVLPIPIIPFFRRGSWTLISNSSLPWKRALRACPLVLAFVSLFGYSQATCEWNWPSCGWFPLASMWEVASQFISIGIGRVKTPLLYYQNANKPQHVALSVSIGMNSCCTSRWKSFTSKSISFTSNLTSRDTLVGML
jgi:hypothetical protein